MFLLLSDCLLKSNSSYSSPVSPNGSCSSSYKDLMQGGQHDNPFLASLVTGEFLDNYCGFLDIFSELLSLCNNVRSFWSSNKSFLANPKTKLKWKVTVHLLSTHLYFVIECYYDIKWSDLARFSVGFNTLYSYHNSLSYIR